MGEALRPFAEQLPQQEWVLIGHGDWVGGLRKPNAAEPGVYMPLSRRDIEMVQPARVFLGHIHAAKDFSPVHYVGSPCDLDITETGRRRYLVYDTAANQVESLTLVTPLLYFNARIVVMPVEDEDGYLRALVAARQQEWDLTPAERAKTQLRVKVAGYSTDRAALRRTLLEAFAGFTFHKGLEPDIDDVYVTDDLERQYIADQVRASVEALVWAEGAEEPDRNEILLKALHIVYGH